MAPSDMGKIAFVVIALLLAGVWIFWNIQSHGEHQVGETVNAGTPPKVQSMKDGTYTPGPGTPSGSTAPDAKAAQDPMSLGSK